jgi:hypothetical protein
MAEPMTNPFLKQSRDAMFAARALLAAQTSSIARTAVAAQSQARAFVTRCRSEFTLPT